MAATICLLSAFLLWALPAQAKPLGSDLDSTPNAGICATPVGGVTTVCTETQLWLDGEESASEHLYPNPGGVITRWWVASGPASPATAGVELRLRLLRNKGPLPGAATGYEQLPLGEPGVHRFSTRLPIAWGARLALDVAVLGSGEGTASAPIAHAAPGVGEIGEWVPSLGSSPRLLTYQLRNTELLLRAGIEGDLDDDGYGDRTQDRCRYDPRRRQPCLEDHRPPHVEVRYAKRQSFLDDGMVRMKVRSDQLGNVWIGGSLEAPRISTTWIGIGSEAWVKPGQWADLYLYLEPRARAGARQELEGGGRPYIEAEAGAFDTSGNDASGQRVLVRLPER
jgi:hypothetical protein